MKVHVLWYDYYEDSNIVGIYTEEGKKKKMAEIQAEAYDFYQDLKNNLEELSILIESGWLETFCGLVESSPLFDFSYR